MHKSGLRDKKKMKKHPTYIKHTTYSKFHYNMQLGTTGTHIHISKYIKMTPKGTQIEEKETSKLHSLPGKKEKETTNNNITLPHVKC